MTRARTRRLAAGFTLIEILVAFAILAVSLVALFHAFSDGLAATGRVEKVSTAVLLARSTLERVGTEIPLVEGSRVGDIPEGGHWTVEVGRSPLVGEAPLSVTSVAPYEVRVTVTLPDSQPVALTTLRLGPAPQAAPR